MPQEPSAQDEHVFHTYTTHRVPWYVHVLWIGYIAALIWYVLVYAAPSARGLFQAAGSG